MPPVFATGMDCVCQDSICLCVYAIFGPVASEGGSPMAGAASREGNAGRNTASGRSPSR